MTVVFPSCPSRAKRKSTDQFGALHPAGAGTRQSKGCASLGKHRRNGRESPCLVPQPAKTIGRVSKSACERFAATHVLFEVARETGIREQVLRNKLNADQPHKPVEEMIAIYHATGDETLLDGALFDCGLTAVKLPDGEAKPHLVASAVEINANVAGGIGMHALEVTQSGRVTKGQRNTIVSAATVAMGQLAIIISEVEHKFQTVPAVGCCADALRGVAGI